MEPKIRYAKTSDGVNIAFATYGEGRPFVWSNQPRASHVQLEWQQPLYRAAYSLLAETGMLVRFDTRGVGLSDRDVDDLSLDARVRDLETVADHLHLNSFALLGFETGGLPAIAYATRHPRRVSHLVLINCALGGLSTLSTVRGKALYAIADEDDWEMFTENLGAAVFGFGREETQRHGEFIRACQTPEMHRRMMEANREIDVSGLLAQIQAPTLVVRHSGIKWLPMDVTREMASGIPNARLLVIEGLYVDNTEQLFRAVADFLGLEEQRETEAELAETGAFRTVLFTDVEGSTALTQRLGDAKARDLLRQHERMVRDALKAHGGSELKTTGDGFMASFSSATRALESAIAMQRAFAANNESAEEPILVRVGMNAGEPVAEEKDLYGTAVNLAARICGHAEAGQILASDVVRQLVAGKDFLFADRGEANLKGFDEPVRLFDVRWQEES